MAQTTITDVVDNLVITTLRSQPKKLFDNVFKNLPLTDRLLKGKKVNEVGGREIVIGQMTKKNTSAKFIKPYGTVDVDPKQFTNAGVATWRHAIDSAVYSPIEAAYNTGEAAIINYVKSIITNAEDSLSEKVSDSMLTSYVTPSDGGDGMDPISLAIHFDPTSAVSYLGIDPSAETYHRNQVKNFQGDTTFAQVKLHLFQLLGDCSKGKGGRPTFAVCDFNTYYMLVGALAAQQTNASDMGHEHIRALGIDIFPDESIVSGTTGDAITTLNGTIYVMNEDWMQVSFLTGRKLEVGKFIETQEADGRAAKITTSLTWYLTSRRKHGVGFNVPTSLTA